jgi:hypothetical protein
MELTIKKEIEEIITLELPAFFKKDERYIGVLNERTLIKWTTAKGLTTYQNGEMWLFKIELKEAITDWIAIGETEFMAAHEHFLHSMSLQPQLHNVDDLKGVL